MKKILDVLKKYIFIAFLLSITMEVWVIVSRFGNATIPTIDLLYIIKDILATLIITIILVPVVALGDLFIIQSSKALFKDYKNADKKGRIIIIVVFVIILLRKIAIWTR